MKKSRVRNFSAEPPHEKAALKDKEKAARQTDGPLFQ